MQTQHDTIHGKLIIDFDSTKHQELQVTACELFTRMVYAGCPADGTATQTYTLDGIGYAVIYYDMKRSAWRMFINSSHNPNMLQVECHSYYAAANKVALNSCAAKLVNTDKRSKDLDVAEWLSLSEWLPLSEAPKDEHVLLLFVINDTGALTVETAIYDSSIRKWRSGTWVYNPLFITHERPIAWMPCKLVSESKKQPEVPKGKKLSGLRVYIDWNTPTFSISDIGGFPQGKVCIVSGAYGEKSKVSTLSYTHETPTGCFKCINRDTKEDKCTVNENVNIHCTHGMITSLESILQSNQSIKGVKFVDIMCVLSANQHVKRETREKLIKVLNNAGYCQSYIATSVAKLLARSD